MELLLDTICNVFGGIVFIAILLAVLTTHPPVVADSDIDPVDSHQVLREQRQLQGELQQYAQALELLERNRQMLASEQVVHDLQQLEWLARNQQDVEQQIAQLEAWLAEYRALTAHDVQAISQQRLALKQRLNELEQQQQKIEQQQTVEVRLPQERTTQLIQTLVLFQHNRVYWLPLRAGRLAVDANDVAVEQTRDGSLVRPHLTGGFAATDDVGKHPRFRRIVSGIRPTSHYFHCFVAPDSVEAFSHFKNAVLALGFNYNVSPVEPPLVLVSSSEQRTIQ